MKPWGGKDVWSNSSPLEQNESVRGFHNGGRGPGKVRGREKATRVGKRLKVQNQTCRRREGISEKRSFGYPQGGNDMSGKRGKRRGQPLKNFCIREDSKIP